MLPESSVTVMVALRSSRTPQSAVVANRVRHAIDRHAHACNDAVVVVSGTATRSGRQCRRTWSCDETYVQHRPVFTNVSDRQRHSVKPRKHRLSALRFRTCVQLIRGARRWLPVDRCMRVRAKHEVRSQIQLARSLPPGRCQEARNTCCQWNRCYVSHQTLQRPTVGGGQWSHL
jgi:hypothetical protein